MIAANVWLVPAILAWAAVGVMGVTLLVEKRTDPEREQWDDLARRDRRAGR